MTMTITHSDKVGGDILIGGILTITKGTKEYSRKLITDIPNATTITFRDWTWMMSVISWNPCNNLVDLYV